ncbi:hypothetical protein CBW65_14860 [Tumebacillus avium]|uniref:Uncharacterized protein n=1 Tax=Tumebacillus avium TaxID=1903704 RepID=A0A1Y0IQL8_9BACL|nr:hypothetical protein [Tumebacillus avium]ARU62136.1 hypothetical protein CBW65_14860 [Tumebacillus avium]
MIIFADSIKWDGNEAFILGLILLLVALQWYLIRKFPLPVTVSIWVLNYLLVKLADLTIGVPPLDFYDTMDRPMYEWSDISTHAFVYPILGFLFIYAYQRWQLRGIRLAAYIVLWSAVSVVFEWSAVYSQIFHYKGWKIGWSFFVYLTVFLINLIFYENVQKWLRAVVK